MFVFRVATSVALAIACWSSTFGYAAAETRPALEDLAGVASLPWSTAALALPDSHATLVVPKHTRALDRDGIARLAGIVGGAVIGDEAFVRYDRLGSDEFSFCRCGYAPDGDWNKLDPAFLLASIRSSARKLAGTPYTTIYGSTDILGWASPPHYDERRHTVSWMIHAAHPDGSDFYNARAMVLGRYGYETIVADMHGADAKTTWAVLQQGIAAFDYRSGYRYSDRLVADGPSGFPLSMATMMAAGADVNRVEPPGSNRSGHVVNALINLVYLALLLCIPLLLVVGFTRSKTRPARAR